MEVRVNTGLDDRKNIISTKEDDRHNMVAVFPRTFDLVVLLTSLLQVCWILKVVIWKGEALGP